MKSKLAKNKTVAFTNYNPLYNIFNLILGLLLLIFIINTSLVNALPEGATINVTESSFRVNDAVSTLNALAGNVSIINLDGKTVTQSWAGFSGNISGKITLENGQNSIMIDWTATNPHGEVYASNNTITFTDGNVFCFNFTQSTANGHLNVTNYELSMGMYIDSSDGVDETFNQTIHPMFYAGTNTIQQNKCPSVNLYQNSTNIGTDFQEILLYDNTSKTLIYTSIINQDKQGFDNRTYDFQMILAENGHNADGQTTPYYFYVELE